MTSVRTIPLILLIALLTTGFDWGFGGKDKCGEARALLRGAAAKSPAERQKDEARIRGLCPDGSAVHVLEGRRLEQEGKQEEAISEYRVALKIDPILPEASRALGLIYLQKGQSDEAAVELTKGLADGGDPRTQRALATIFADKKFYPLAAYHYTAALSAYPDDLSLHLGLADTLRHMGSRDDAEKQYLNCLTLDSKNTDALLGLAALYEEMDQPAKALDQAKRRPKPSRKILRSMPSWRNCTKKPAI